MITGRKYPNAASVFEVYQRLEERLRTLGGVTAVGRVSALPLSQMMAWGPITVEGRPLVPGEAFINVDQRTVGGDYFNTMQIPLIAGRAFNEHDLRTSLLVVVVDAQMANTLWPNGDAIGQRVRVGGADSTSRGSPSWAWLAASNRTRSTPTRAWRCTLRIRSRQGAR